MGGEGAKRRGKGEVNNRSVPTQLFCPGHGQKRYSYSLSEKDIRTIKSKRSATD